MPTPFDQRIQQQRRQIRRHDGNDSGLRERLNKLQQRRFNYKQSQPVETPWSGQYESTVGQLNLEHNQDELASAQQEQQIEKEYGFNNNSDPFSRQTLLKQNYENARRGTGNNYAAAGQLYAGSLSNARDIDRQGFEQGYDALSKDYQSQLAALQQRRLDSQNDYNQGLLSAEAGRLESALAEPIDPAEAAKAPKWNPGKNAKKKNQGQNQKNNKKDKKKR